MNPPSIVHVLSIHCPHINTLCLFFHICLSFITAIKVTPRFNPSHVMLILFSLYHSPVFSISFPSVTPLFSLYIISFCHPPVFSLYHFLLSPSYFPSISFPSVTLLFSLYIVSFCHPPVFPIYNFPSITLLFSLYIISLLSPSCFFSSHSTYPLGCVTHRKVCVVNEIASPRSFHSFYVTWNKLFKSTQTLLKPPAFGRERGWQISLGPCGPRGSDSGHHAGESRKDVNEMENI